MNRKLASVRKVSRVEPIENADRIELAHVDGWQVIVKKGEFKPGDRGIYFEIDSKLPEKPEYEFMRPRKFKVKTVKMRGVLSQGLLLPPGIYEHYAPGSDLTDILGITKIGDHESQEYENEKPKKRWWHIFFKPGKKNRGFPPYIPKTDEERVQNIGDVYGLTRGKPLYYMEKLDGQSVTIFFKRNPWWKGDVFGVCSRNIQYWKRQNNNWRNAAVISGLHQSLPRLCKGHGLSLAVQGEIVGPGIQGNKYGLVSQKLFIFSIWDIDNQCYLEYGMKRNICAALDVSMVPTMGFLESDHCEPYENPRQFFLDLAKGYSSLNPAVKREGIVVRGVTRENVSFKAINDEFLLEYDHG